MKSLLAPFGNDGIYVIGSVLTVAMILIVLAFQQGRAIQFWPPKIGAGLPRPRVRRTASTADRGSPASAPALAADTNKVFEVADAAQFYQSIAQNYDQRNSANLISTHMEVITRIDQLRQMNPWLSVLDLGGGTGQNVATYFFDDPKIRWSYVDYCPAMINQLRQHLAGRRLYERLSVHLEDINSFGLRLAAGAYDVVLLNLVLSSMPQLPDFSRIANLVAPGGRLIIADINPAYTHAHPYFRAMASDGTFVSMRMHPVQPLEMATRAKDAGLQLTEMTQIGSDAISYSFIITFTKLRRPGEE